MTGLPFVKMHGLGNDYVYVNGFIHDVPDPPALARAVSLRHTGIGSDGLILLLPAEAGIDADLRMRMFNADGSESEMCGNGLRCVARMAFDHGICPSTSMRIAAGSRIVDVRCILDDSGGVDRVTVDLGEPVFESAGIPFLSDASPELEAAVLSGPLGPHLDRDSLDVSASVVSMGNPHLVLFVRNAEGVPLAEAGPVLERHAAFPQRVNVHVAQVSSRGHIVMRTWERGSGETRACGSGAAAVCVVAARTGRADRSVAIDLPGGRLLLEWDVRSGRVAKTGPATEVFTGIWPDRLSSQTGL